MRTLGVRHFPTPGGRYYRAEFFHFLSRTHSTVMPICGVVGCSNKPSSQKGISFHKVPTIIRGQGEETQKLSEERRRLWKAAINRKDITSEEKWDRTLVCSKHFVGGIKAYLHDRTSPSWLPTLCLGHSACIPESAATSRYRRASQRGEKRKRADAITSLLNLKTPRLESDLQVNEQTQLQDRSTSDGNSCEQSSLDSDLDIELEIQDTNYEVQESKDSTTGTSKEVQTELTVNDIENIENDNKARLADSNCKVPFTRQDLYSFEGYEKDPDKVSFYTGLPNLGGLKRVFNFIEAQMSNGSKNLTKENQFMLCLIKLRMDYAFQDMSVQLNVSVATIHRIFHATLNILYKRLSFLVHWPEREHVRVSMPMTFRKEFGDKVVVILDCFELNIEKPSGSLNKVYTYSNYKHRHTVKYLIGIAPQGTITFISEGWGGRTSDKHITEESGLLDNLLPGDIVMVDRGFSIEESVNFYQAKLAIPSFTRGKSQLHPMEVEQTRKIANVRIHVERVIGLLCRKFRIFDSVVPLEFLKLKSGEEVPTIDKIVKVCCCLTNLCPSVVPFD
ncbi:uncharacterized protein LOC106154716 [Lingula anatina]|uniref:Uncharacterized protein LOC106152914 n=1 Tax=Lingula anatina TaxID=7574 RepID=A0A1S3H9G5_LINAN|nr:uncharacterized protein LOC106152914 [Lingula anatina]XP_013384628.1 uncharacterized protein LOC106154716 [Lingula anatina]|eukprot:XP_013382111.1 uncharacterized protein LOC106152914 [Lingula anatina]